MLRLASSLVSKVRLAEKSICPVTATCRFSCAVNNTIDYFEFGAYDYAKREGSNPACDVIYEYIIRYPGYKYFPVLAQALFAEGMKLLIEGDNKTKLLIGGENLVQGLNKAQDVIMEHLTCRTQKICSSEQLAQVATAAANGDKKLGEIIRKATEEVRGGGFIFISHEKKSKLNYEIDFDSGMKLDWGTPSRYFFTNQREYTCNFKNPFILILNKNKLLEHNVVQQVMESTGYRRPLLVVVGDVLTAEVAGSLMLDWTCRGAKFCVVDSFYVKGNKKAIMQDLAVLTGGQIVTEESDLKSISQMLGSCKEVRATYKETIIIGGSGGLENIEKRCEQLRSAIKSSTSKYEVNLLKKRLVKLSQVATVIKVGGTTIAEMRMKKSKVRVVLNAVESAISDGILPGGGVALLHASKVLDKLEVTNSAEELGVRLLQQVLKIPVYSIASTAGFDGWVVVEKLLEQDNPNLGYNPARGEYVDMIKKEIVDPSKLVRDEFRNVLRSFVIDISSGTYGS